MNDYIKSSSKHFAAESSTVASKSVLLLILSEVMIELVWLSASTLRKINQYRHKLTRMISYVRLLDAPVSGP
jgi:hypothetical protein